MSKTEGYQIRHCTYGVLQGRIETETYWSLVSKQPTLGYKCFKLQEDAEQVVTLLVETGAYGKTSMTVEPFDAEANNLLQSGVI